MLIQIANPLYDVVFKGLMQDLDAAKTLISSILEMKVLDLELKPQEYNSEIDLFSIYRVDFKAKVELEDGSDLIVLIELQKIKFFNQTFRFRRYIGNQYANKDNMKGNDAIPIITIYILGHHLQVHDDVPIIRVKRQYLVHGSEDVLKEKEPFIEGISHDAIVIQIPAIKKKKGKKTDLEKVLSVFDVAMMRFVEFEESEFPLSYYSILKRLIYISKDVETQRQMDVEDDFLDELRIREESHEELQMKLEEKNKLLKEEKKRVEEKDKLLEAEKKRVEEEKKRAEENRSKLLGTAKFLKSQKYDIQAIMNITGLTEQEIEGL
jgi:hypothetical protein